MESPNESSRALPIEKIAQELEFSYVPECYRIPSPHRASLNPDVADVSIVDLSSLNEDSAQRSIIVEKITNSCRHNGFFQVINHGIPQSVLDDALAIAFEFFNLPTNEKVKFLSNDVHKPVRYGTSLRDGVDKIQFWRIFLKHYANPLNEWIKMWPNKPANYREKMGEYTKEVRELAMKIWGLITEGLGLGQAYLNNKMDQGVQVITVNCYPACPQPSLALGLPPHSDYTCITIILQSSTGLEILHQTDQAWKAVSNYRGSLQVHVGDHLEVMSNGLYKSVPHRVTLSKERTRVSIASRHGLGLDEKMAPAQELVDEEKNPKGYKESSFKDFLNFITKNDIGEGKSFINTLKLK